MTTKTSTSTARTASQAAARHAARIAAVETPAGDQARALFNATARRRAAAERLAGAGWLFSARS